MDNGYEKEKQFLSRLEDRLMRLEKRYVKESTDFLEPPLQQMAQEYLQRQKFLQYQFWGGFEQAQRKRLILYPAYDQPMITPEDIFLIYLKGNFKFTQANHRDFLGAIMSMGMKREKFGDLITNEQGCYVFATEEAANYISSQQLKIKGVPITTHYIDWATWQAPQTKTKEIDVLLSSLRLDAIIAHGFGLSRSKATEAINSGKVQKNYLPALAVDEQCKVGDMLSFRGKGKLQIDEIVRETKKGKLELKLLKYI